MNKNHGFTLIELIVVIVILAILAATALPKFVNLTDDALHAKVSANAGALRSGVKLANMKWRALGSPSNFSQRNDIQLYGNDVSGQIDINPEGYPAQSFAGSDEIISTDSYHDCLSLWQALIENGDSNASNDDSAEIIIDYEGGGICSYKLTENNIFGFTYEPKTGQVVLL
jgi:prepilin-type N-terminal cleavage/methylation domain-containing protein